MPETESLSLEVDTKQAEYPSQDVHDESSSDANREKMIHDKEGSYFDAEALATQLKARQSLALQAERDEVASINTAESPTVSTPGVDGLSIAPRTPGAEAPAVKKAPGWKGWLRGASSSTSTSFRLDLGRKSPISPQLNTARAVVTSSQSCNNVSTIELFEKLRASAPLDGPTIDWAFYDDILRGDSPREISGMHQKIRMGIPDELRGLVWQTLAKSKDVELENVFQSLVQDPTYRYEKQIKKDIARMSKSWDKQIRKDA